MERPVRKSRPVEHLTAQQFRDLKTSDKTKGSGPHRNKYGAKRISTDDGEFHSNGEYRRYCELKLLERSGAVADLQRQVRIPLVVNGIHLSIENKIGVRRYLNYIADFTYYENGKYVIEDFKGFDTKDSRIKRAIVEATQGVRVRITTR